MSKILKIFLTFIAIIVAAYVLSIKFIRIDLTSEGRYTLSDYTKENLDKLTEPIYVKIYLEGDDLPMNFKTLRQAVQEQLDEFSIYAGGGLEYVFINPTENKDKEVRFGIYKDLMDKGITPIETNEISAEGKTAQKMVFPAALLSFKGRETAVNLLKNDPKFPRESEQNVNNSVQALEYELMNALKKIEREKKPEIVFIEGHGELDEYQTMDASSILSEYYMVKRGEIKGRVGVLDGFEAVIVAKPELEFSEQDKFVIDQYIMKGGKVLWLTDGAQVNIDSLRVSARTFAVGREQGLLDMLFTYGVRVNYDLVQDKQASVIGLPEDAGGGQVRVKPYPWNFFPLILSDNTHAVNKYLDVVKTEFVSSIDTIAETPNVKKTILLHTSLQSRNDQVPVEIRLDMVRDMADDPLLKEGEFNVAVLLEGKFESAYKFASVGAYFPGFPKDSVRTESVDTKMIVVSDGDLIRNDFDQSGKPRPLGYDPYSRRIYYGNGQFILNAVNYLCEDGGLMSIRTRELKIRVLDKDLLYKNRVKIQILNIITPIIVLIIFGVFIFLRRKQKYRVRL